MFWPNQTLDYHNDLSRVQRGIFYHTPEQKAEAEQIMGELEASGVWPQPMVTEVRPFAQFYPAEEYHHQYYRQNPEQGYCQVVIAPKLKEP
jgi:peptide-methionine (S)-S-oxide reductase